MIKSMTGFGRCEAADEERKFTVEMKGVNHRYLDANIRMPKKLNFFESAIRSLLKESVHRGKVDIFITYEDFSESQVSLKYNETLAAEYLEKFKMMEEKFSLENDIRVSTLSRYPRNRVDQVVHNLSVKRNSHTVDRIQCTVDDRKVQTCDFTFRSQYQVQTARQCHDQHKYTFLLNAPCNCLYDQHECQPRFFFPAPIRKKVLNFIHFPIPPKSFEIPRNP